MTMGPSDERQWWRDATVSPLDGWRACTSGQARGCLPRATRRSTPNDCGNPKKPTRHPRASDHRATHHQRVCRLRPPARAQSAGLAALVSHPTPSSGPIQDTGSPSAGAPWLRATSMRPRESEGKAVGLDEDDNGAVRRLRAGPQSWARVAMAPPPMGDLRSAHRPRPKPIATNEAPPTAAKSTTTTYESPHHFP